MEEAAEKIWFEDYTFPRRSLGQTGFRILMGIIIVLSFLIGTMFYWLGAWPVSGFFGLDVLLIYWAFKIQYEHGKAVEIVRLTDDALTITQIDHKGKRQDFSYNSYWVSVCMRKPENVPGNINDTYPQARSHGRGTYFGIHLNQEMRFELMNAVSQALVQCKNNRF